VISVKDGEFEVESSRYPFCPCEPEGEAATSYPICGQDGLDSDNSIRSGMTLISFNQQLNRLTLIAKYGTASRYEFIWGDESKTFNAQPLAQGINLPVEFPSNPFSAAFAKANAAVAAKQACETREVKKLFRGTDSRMSMGQIAAQTDKMVGETEKQHVAFVAAIHSSFMPVTHVIRIVAQ
jgi:hypothetical protein